MDYLNDLQKAKIEAFVKDEEMMGAVEKVLLAGIYEHGTIQEGHKPNPLENAAFHLAAISVQNPIPNEILGQHIRGMWYGVNALKNGFDRLKAIKTEKNKDIESPYNEAE